MQETLTNLLNERFPGFLDKCADAVVDASVFRDDVTVIIRKEKIRDVIGFLKNDSNLKFDVMMDLFGMDYELYKPEHPERFAVVYQLVALFQKHRIFLKVYVSEADCTVDSIHDLYAAANWFEREAWDLFGISFKGHPNQVRILCHNEFVGHPLRKDYQSDKYQPLRTVSTSKEI